jgi:hypothetical protein
LTANIFHLLCKNVLAGVVVVNIVKCRRIGSRLLNMLFNIITLILSTATNLKFMNCFNVKSEISELF